MTTFKWINNDKSRYYTINIQHNIKSGISLYYSWGGINSNRGGNKNVSVSTQKEAEHLIEKMVKRRKARGYKLMENIGSSCLK